MPPIYTFGYSGKQPAELQTLVTELDAVVFDIRFSPRSRQPQWSGGRLRALLGDRYQHVKALGNVNYRGGPIQLVDFDAGLAQIQTQDQPIILMCVCRDPAQCHRTTVADLLRAQGYTVQEAGQLQRRLL